MKQILVLPIAALLMLTLTQCQKNKQGFTLKNQTGFELVYVFATPITDSNWGQDRLGDSEKIAKDADRYFAMDGYEDDVCDFDVRADDENQRSYEIRRVNLCEIDELAITPQHAQ